jgi:hypothetical protein
MKSKTKMILTWIPSVVISVAIIMGAVMKLAFNPQLVEIYSRIGLLEYMPVLGIAEILFVVLFLLKRSMKIGFCLLTGYFGGAMAVEMSHGAIFIIPAVILSIVWISAYLRDHSLFKMTRTGRTIITAN